VARDSRRMSPEVQGFRSTRRPKPLLES
jgi:hypothetical protein